MSDMWALVGVLAVVSFAIRAAGPVALAGRELRPGVTRLIVLLPVALFTSLVIVQTLASGRELTVDARSAGVAAAIVAVAVRAPVLVVLTTAALTTAGLRALA